MCDTCVHFLSVCLSVQVWSSSYSSVHQHLHQLYPSLWFVRVIMEYSVTGHYKSPPPPPTITPLYPHSHLMPFGLLQAPLSRADTNLWDRTLVHLQSVKCPSYLAISDMTEIHVLLTDIKPKKFPIKLCFLGRKITYVRLLSVDISTQHVMC